MIHIEVSSLKTSLQGCMTVAVEHCRNVQLVKNRQTTHFKTSTCLAFDYRIYHNKVLIASDKVDVYPNLCFFNKNALWAKDGIEFRISEKHLKCSIKLTVTVFPDGRLRKSLNLYKTEIKDRLTVKTAFSRDIEKVDIDVKRESWLCKMMNKFMGVSCCKEIKDKGHGYEVDLRIRSYDNSFLN